MRIAGALLAALLTLQPSLACAEATAFVPPPARRQLLGVSAEEAEALIGKLQDAQRRLKAGDNQLFFELVAGSLASYDMTKVSAREAFLQVQFDKVWNIERVPTDNRHWQPYKLSYAPNGLGQLYWEIEAVLGFEGKIERVAMIYKPPAPL